MTKRYKTQDSRDGLAVLDASLSLAQGEFVSLIGPSGCGKTTLLKMAAGLISQTEGNVLFEGEPGTPPAERKGVVFQSPVLLPWKTVLENIILPARIQRQPLDQARQRGRDLLTLLQIDGTEDHYPSELSGGMQQRVAIARSLLNTPEVLFMDEPFGALDAMTRESLNEELQSVHAREHVSVMFVTHSISEAVFLSDRIAVMSAGPGRIVDAVDVPLKRPRTTEDYIAEEFREIESRVRKVLDEFSEGPRT